MKSIRTTALIFVMIGTLVAAIVTITCCYWLNKKSYLDAQKTYLATTAKMLAHIAAHDLDNLLQLEFKRISVQINDADNKQRFESSNFPDIALPLAGEFKTTQQRNKTWLTYHLYNEHTEKHIILATPLSQKKLREYLGYTIVYIIMAVFILAGMLIYYALHQTLKYIPILTNELNKKASNKLEPISATNYPKELQVMIIELNQLFFRVQDAFNRNKRFSADAAHELRTPLTALKTQAQLALQMTDPKEQRKALQNVEISVNRSIHVVQQLLTLSRLDHEQELNDVVPVNIQTICAEMIAYLYPHALEKNIEIELINDTSSAIILGNDASLGILLRNLIDNAIRYTPKNGKVEVALTEGSSHVTLSVSDNGPGIPEQYREKIFDRFFRVLGTKQTGSGLGLAIVKQITDLHGAQIFLNQPSSGIGLTVTIKFKTYQARLN